MPDNIVFSGSFLAKLFKALGNPLRAMIIYRMLDGKPYTKESLYLFLRNLKPDVTRNIVDRHIRTLEKYGIIRAYETIRKSGRGRRPIAYVLTSNVNEFYNKLFSFILENISVRRTTLMDNIRGNINIIQNMVSNIIIQVYLVQDLSEKDLRMSLESLRRCAESLVMVSQIIQPDYSIDNCTDALNFIKRILDIKFLHRWIPGESIYKLLISSYIDSIINKDQLFSLLKLESEIKNNLIDERIKEEITYRGIELLKNIAEGCNCNDECSDFVVILANNLVKYITSMYTEDKGLLILSLLT